MTRIVVFGAGGRAGRAVTAEALRRGFGVTAVVRDPLRHAALGERAEVRLVRGDITDAASVAGTARGAVAAVHAVSPMTETEAATAGFTRLDPAFFARTADVLCEGLAAAGVDRLLTLGLFALLRTADGGYVRDRADLFPPAYLPFARAHQAGLDRFAERGGHTPDWVQFVPPAHLDPEAPARGTYRVGPAARAPEDPAGRLAYADLALALLDEVERPAYHRQAVAVTG
ncbi:NAD(P)-dependent oxidoreductase [Streptomyces sp. P6-2-1]|uniref:NAD(P)-dependent oxidoreductase n=1 Tax=Streptomyces sp. P6-2-1 TaxID=3422591 RepID=UPI003D35C4AF